MNELLTVLAVLLIPAGLLPVVTFLVLRRYRNSEARSLRDRYHVSIALALVGMVTSVLAILALTDLDTGDSFWVLFGLIILAADLVSGKWLLDYWRGKFA